MEMKYLIKGMLCAAVDSRKLMHQLTWNFNGIMLDLMNRNFQIAHSKTP
jgi:hypothetical protein